MTPPLPDLVLYARPGCHLCEEARASLEALLAERSSSGLAVPRLVERNIEDDDAWLASYALTIPVVVLGDRSLELATSPARLRRLLADALDGGAAGVTGDYTFLGAVLAGVVSFLSPCVLPLVPAYLGQLTAIAVAAKQDGRTPSRWTALRYASAYVVGFGAVFTLLGITATFAGGALADYLPALRVIGGLILVVMGLSLAGLLRVPVLERTWRPLDAGAAASLTTMTGGMTLAPAEAGVGGRVGSRLVGGRAGLGAAFALGAIFAIGWTPCIGIILGGILTLAAVADTKLQGALLLVGYTLGLGIPFLVIAVFYDRAPAVMRPLVRHGRAVSLVGGLLVAGIGVAMIFDWLVLLPRFFNFTPLL